MTLNEDFGIWWDMAKYKEVDIPARQYGEVQITAKHGSGFGWKGEPGVKYWVELENGWAVGVITPRKTPATFPFYAIE